MNKWIGTGHLVADPEMRKTQNGKTVCNFRVAVNRRFKTDSGPDADFISCVAFEKTAEFISKFFQKGKMIAVDGRIQTRNWTDDNGDKHYATEIMVDNAEFCGSKNDDAPKTYSSPRNNVAPKKDEPEDIEDGDLPF